MAFKKITFLLVTVLLGPSSAATQQIEIREIDFRNHAFPWNRSSDPDSTTWEWDDIRKLIVWDRHSENDRSAC